MYVSFVPNHRLVEFADSLFKETDVKEQVTDEDDNVTAVIWDLDGPRFLQQAHLNTVLRIPTWDFVDALVPLSEHFGYNIPCVQA
jgi:hypothetical protein